MFVVFLDSTHIAETPSDSNIQDSLHSLNSHHVYKTLFIFVEEEEEIDHLQINKKKKTYGYRDVYCLSDCSLKKIVQKHVVTALIASYWSINIL